MTDLETYITTAGADACAAQLLNEPFFSSFNTLWQGPGQIAPTCNYFASTTLDELKAFAGTLNDGSGWVIHHDQLSQWLNPRPGVTLADLEQVQWATVRDVLIGGLVPTDPVYWVIPEDAVFYLPTPVQLATIMSNCPAKRYPLDGEHIDCDDHTRILRGWLSAHGLGQLAVGFGGYTVYGSNNNVLGSHALGLAICTDRQPYLAEPRDGKVYPINTVGLGGFIFANRIQFTLAQF